MAEKEVLNLTRFQFRGLHPQVSMGTASDRYAGWIDRGVHATIVVNNRAGGNAPLIAQRISESFLEKQGEGSHARDDTYSFKIN
jgi:hypothetical protein